VGRDLSWRFAAEEWGGKIMDQLARDLQTEFPGFGGFSPLNLRYMHSLADSADVLCRPFFQGTPISLSFRLVQIRVRESHILHH